MESLEEILEVYGAKTTNELVDTTYQKDSRLDIVFRDGNGRNDIIEIV